MSASMTEATGMTTWLVRPRCRRIVLSRARPIRPLLSVNGWIDSN